MAWGSLSRLAWLPKDPEVLLSLPPQLRLQEHANTPAFVGDLGIKHRFLYSEHYQLSHCPSSVLLFRQILVWEFSVFVLLGVELRRLDSCISWNFDNFSHCSSYVLPCPFCSEIPSGHIHLFHDKIQALGLIFLRLFFFLLPRLVNFNHLIFKLSTSFSSLLKSVVESLW